MDDVSLKKHYGGCPHDCPDTCAMIYEVDDNNRLIKDDQIIVLNNIVENMSKFVLVAENSQYDNWFLFQRFLL